MQLGGIHRRKQQDKRHEVIFQILNKALYSQPQQGLTDKAP